MRNKRFITIGLLSILMLILTGGLAYAASTGSGHHNPARPAATATATARSHSHQASQACHTGYQHHGSNWWCDWQGYGNQRGTGHHAYQGNSNHRQGYQGNGSQGYRHHGSYQGNWAHQGNWGHQGHGSHGSGWYGHRQHRRGNGGCGSRWH